MIELNKNILIVGTIFLVFLGFLIGYLFRLKSDESFSKNNVTQVISEKLDTKSPYVGQEVRGIKSLSQDEIKGLMAGEGTPFGGMAKLAELNGYPGPRHVLDMGEELKLSEKQTVEITSLYEQMRRESIALGEQIIDKERELDIAFANSEISEKRLKSGTEESAQIYADLRFTHLKYHLAMMNILDENQIAKYSELRGYTGIGNPCENVPEGHDPELWKMHNNCI